MPKFIKISKSKKASAPTLRIDIYEVENTGEFGVNFYAEGNSIGTRDVSDLSELTRLIDQVLDAELGWDD